MTNSDIQRNLKAISKGVAAEVVRASGKHRSWMPTHGGFLGMPNWEEILGYTQNPLERLCISSSLGKSRDPPRRSGKYLLGEYLDIYLNIWNILLSLLTL